MTLLSKRSLTVALAVGGMGVLALPAFGSAHSILTGPAPRAGSGIGDITGPCGGHPRAGTVTDYVPGQVITVEWTEHVRHNVPPGATFSINFSPSGDAGFTELASEPVSSNPIPAAYARQVTLPTAPTSEGTLQLVYNTTGGANIYYSCANVRIVTAVTPQPAPPPPAPADTAAPRMAMPKTATRKMGAARAAGHISFPVRCDEGCTTLAELRITGALAKRLGIPTTKRSVLVGSSAAGTLAANIPGTLRVRLTKRMRSAMATAKTLVATLTTTVRDAAGNQATSTTRITLK